MLIVLTLVLAPCLAGVVLLFLNSETSRRVVVGIAASLVCVVTALLAFQPVPLDVSGFHLNRHWLNWPMLACECGMGAYVVAVGIRARNALVVALMLAQGAAMAAFEWAARGAGAAHELYIDKLSVLMAVINGIVGSGICVYALGYMREYHEKSHPDVADRRPFFFALMFFFMGAMFGLVFANNLAWLFLFWETTTLCSYLLIAYTQTKEARQNALRALVMNLAGGLAFALAILWFYTQTNSIELQYFLKSPRSAALLPAALLCFAGITKSAQCPFSSWLLGAMVAPTPVSALLHSSTMVKAGVYLVLRMAPVVAGTTVGVLVATVGGVTFLAGSLAAITTQEAKKVLAYSTVANLGLIVLCGGIGTAAAVWAGALLIVFHATAKCLLFLCVGVVEHKLHSRDIEEMSGLIIHLPRLAAMMLIGMAGMFLAPFGMLISKWAALRAVVDSYPFLCVFIVFGSAATLFFWAKWMGKLLELVQPQERITKELTGDESIPLYALTGTTFLACLLFPLISSHMIEPYLASVYGPSAFVDGSTSTNVILAGMMAVVMLFPVSFLSHRNPPKVVDPYLGGANLEGGARFGGFGGQGQTVTIHNYYLRGILDEAQLARWSVIVSAGLLAVMLAIALL